MHCRKYCDPITVHQNLSQNSGVQFQRRTILPVVEALMRSLPFLAGQQGLSKYMAGPVESGESHERQGV